MARLNLDLNAWPQSSKASRTGTSMHSAFKIKIEYYNLSLGGGGGGGWNWRGIKV